MNRNGSIAIVDEKGREKERYAIVYGAKLKVEDGAQVTLGDQARRVGSVHLLAPHRDRRHRPVQGPAGRRHPQRRSRRSHRPLAAWSSPTPPTRSVSPPSSSSPPQGNKRYLMPSPRSPHGGRRRRTLPRRHPCQDPARNHPHQGHHRRSAPRRRALRGTQAPRPGNHLARSTASFASAKSPRASARSTSPPTTDRKRSTAFLAVFTSTCRKANASAPATHSSTVRATRTTFLKSSASAHCRCTSSTKSRKSTVCRVWPSPTSTSRPSSGRCSAG